MKLFGTNLKTKVIKVEREEKSYYRRKNKNRKTEAFKSIQRTITYQFNSSETSNSKGVDDIEIRQLQVGEESSFGFISGFFDAKKWKFLRGANTGTTYNCTGMT